MKKKILLFVIPLLLLVGCELGNTPTSTVENLLTKYQKLDSDINSGIDSILLEQNMLDDQKERYRALIEKQYKNLSYEIKEELIDGNTATVITEIEVIDYKRAISDLVFDNSIYTKETYDNEKLNRLENANEKITYTIEFTLTKDEDDMWRLDALNNEEIKKIQGMY